MIIYIDPNEIEIQQGGQAGRARLIRARWSAITARHTVNCFNESRLMQLDAVSC